MSAPIKYTVDGVVYMSQAELASGLGRSLSWASKKVRQFDKVDFTRQELLGLPTGEPKYKVDGIEYSSHAAIAARFGRSLSWVHRRFKALKKFDVTSHEILNESNARASVSEAVRKAAYARSERIKIVGMDGEYTFSQLPDALEIFGKSDQFFRSRWKEVGQPNPCPREVFMLKKIPDHMRVVRSAMVSCSNLDHIPAGDLAHLNARRNTGAARVHAQENGPQNLGSCLGNVGQVRISLP